MTENEAEYITADEAAKRLGKSASQVRRDARSHLINSIKKSGRIWIRVDERFQALERDPSTRFPADLAFTATAGEATLDPAGSERRTEPVTQTPVADELIDDIAELRAEMARLTARVRKLESRS